MAKAHGQKKIKAKKPIPFDFVLDELSGVSLSTKMMFGCTGVYVGPKIVLILREAIKFPVDNGVWLATTGEHHESLQSIFPNMRSLKVFGPGVTGWQVLPVDADDFEESVLTACQLILEGDPRIGKIPKAKLRTKKSRPRSKSAR